MIQEHLMTSPKYVHRVHVTQTTGYHKIVTILQKLIYLHLFTDCSMKISLDAMIARLERNLYKTVCKQRQINNLVYFLCIKLSIEHSTKCDSRTQLNNTIT